MRCAFCHEQLAPNAARVCPDCGTMVHPVCGDDLFGCPTLGCENPSFGTAPPRATPTTQPGRWRMAAWVLFGLIGPAIAFLLDASMHVDPLAWGRPYPLSHEPGVVFTPTARAVAVWLGVVGSMSGLVLFLCGRIRASLPLLGLGVVVSAAHAVVFVPLLPLSLIGIVLMGLGLLGLCPYVTLWVYLDVYRRAQRRLASSDKPPAGVLLGPRGRRGRGVVLALATLAVLGLHWASPGPYPLPAPAARHVEGVDLNQLRVSATELVADERTHGTWGELVVQPWAECTDPPEPLGQVSEGAEVTVADDYLEFHWSGQAKKAKAHFPYGYSLIVLTDGQELPSAPGTCYRSVELAPGVWSQYVVKSEPAGGGPAFQPLE